MTEDEVRDLIRSYAEKAGSVRALAKEWGVSQPYLDKQIRGFQSVGDKVYRKLRLIRRRVYVYYPETQKGLNEFGGNCGLTVVHHDAWREEMEMGQREQGLGSPMTPAQLTRLLGISPKDLTRILRLGTDFPKPDARVRGRPAWQPQTIYGWLRQKAKKHKPN